MSTDLLEFGSDLAMRYRYFSKGSLAHPAKLHLGLLAWLVQRYTQPGDTIGDPMIGVGSTLYAALLQRNVIGREIEPRWLALAHENAARIVAAGGLFAGQIELGQGDARHPWGWTCDHVLMSPPYGCDAQHRPQRVAMLAQRMNRITSSDPRWQRVIANAATGMGAAALFAFAYGEAPGQIGPWRGPRYWQAMEQIYIQAHAAIRPSGLLILVVKDHIRRGTRVRTADETVALCARLGFRLVARQQRRVYPLSFWQRRRKEQGLPVVEEEDALVLRREP